MMINSWHSQEGMSMVEALVAVAILAIVSAPILGAFMLARSSQAEATGRVIAQSLARTRLEQLQGEAFDSFDSLSLCTSASPCVTTPRPGYTVALTTADVPDYGGNLKTISVSVTWLGAKARTLTYRVETRMERRAP